MIMYIAYHDYLTAVCGVKETIIWLFKSLLGTLGVSEPVWPSGKALGW